MAGGSGEDNPVGINVTAMVDIIFCLCLFFMCSLKFRELDGRMDSWLPKERGPRPVDQCWPPPPPVDELRVLLSYDLPTQTLQRLFVQRPIPAGAAGDRLLRTCLRESYADLRRLGRPDVPVIIDSGPAVPWESVVRVMDLCRGESVPRIEFACGSAPTGR